MGIIRKNLVQKLIHIIEKLHFYPQLKKFYAPYLKNKECVILDVGANKGQSIDFFLSLSSRFTIHAFEPNKKLFKILNIKYNSNQKINFYNKGVSSKNGKLIFHENILDETSTFENINTNSKYLAKKSKILGYKKENLFINHYEVDVIRLVDFINEIGQNIELLKIDVEGHELQCLKGLFDEDNLNQKIRFIQLEKHQDDMYNSKDDFIKINELLIKNNFKITHQIKHGFGDFYELIYVNQDF